MSALTFRKVTTDDLELIRNWRMKPEITQWMYTDPYLTPEDQQAWFEKIENDDSSIYRVVYFEEQPIGLLSLTDIDERNKRATWAYYFGEDAARGKGLGKATELNLMAYAFDELGLEKVCCEVFSENEMVVSLHERFGSKVEGVRRRHIRKGDKWHDVVVMGILREEWEAVRAENEFELASWEPPLASRWAKGSAK